MGTRGRRILYPSKKSSNPSKRTPNQHYDASVLEKISYPSPDAITHGAEVLRDGGLVAIPTETVYGLGADISREEAITRIYQVKGRPHTHPLIVHIGEISLLENISSLIPAKTYQLIEKFWPGPLTIVLKKQSSISNTVTSGKDSIAIRYPSHFVAQKLLKEFHKQGGLGVAAPSANRFGRVSPTLAVDVMSELGEYLDSTDLIFDGGASQVGLESTILDLSVETPTIRRLGSITCDQISEIIGPIEIEINARTAKFSGSDLHHYAPKARVHITSAGIKEGGFLALDGVPTPDGLTRLFSPRSNQEFAHILYSAFRKADREGFTDVVVQLPEGEDIAAAIRDRVNRASS